VGRNRTEGTQRFEGGATIDEMLEGNKGQAIEWASLKSARVLVEGLCARGLKHFVMSPGSRNAPLIRAAAELESAGLLTLHRVLDERSAAHFALGLGQASGRPAVVCCTSGTAVANLGPAIIEAARASAPLLALTADRPAHLHGRGESQTIDQASLHAAHCRKLFGWNAELASPENPQLDEIWHSAQHGPVHVNVPLEDPLYGPAKTPAANKAERIADEATSRQLERKEHDDELWEDGPVMPPEQRAPDFDKFLQALSEARREDRRIMWMLGGDHRSTTFGLTNGIIRDVVLADLHSGICPIVGYRTVDRLMKSEKIQTNWGAFCPDVLVTAGTPFISKALRDLLRISDIEHWHIDPAGQAPDVVRDLRGVVTEKLETVLMECSHLPDPEDEAEQWNLRWMKLNVRMEFAQQNELKQIIEERRLTTEKLIDFQVFEHLTQFVGEDWMVHWGNSTAIRYAHWFGPHWEPSVRHYANRGAAGIEGSTSTAMGQAAGADSRTMLLVCGDLSFLYDAGAWTARPLPANFKVIVINNGGGGIFRWLDGPQEMPSFERDIEARHEISVLGIPEMHGVQTLRAETVDQLTGALGELASAEGPAVLEVLTDGTASAEIFRRVCNIFAA
jgi:2-succinyl-5-enolpyruvyl-6-hydroxy-3-cyclohexene-1-carboxylate synthase